MDAKGAQVLREYIQKRQGKMHYIDSGDRIVVKSIEGVFTGFGSLSLKDEHLGMHGVVLNNDGWGHCRVKLDNGDEVDCWNGKHLEFENANQG